MRNLKLLYNKTKKFNNKNIKSLIIDQEQENISYISTAEKIVQIDFEKNELNNLCDVDNIIGFEFLNLNNEICIANENGEVLLFNLQSKNIETVTFCDGGLKAMSWSADQEVVVFVTNDKKIVVMNSFYDVIAESSLDDSAFGDQEFMTVGWGKKETQFHGSEGKQAAVIKHEVPVIENLDEMDSTVLISWRGDGELFAVSFLGNYGRMFKVFNKEGELQFTSEKCAGLETAFTWKPSGLWIAVPQVFPNKYVIALFEKNGLRHRELVLPFKSDEETVQFLSWSSDSDILAIETVRKGSNVSCLYLYTICNYHWYLKQFFEFSSNIRTIQWDPKHSQGKTLHILLEDGTYSIYRWDFVINHSFGNTDENESIVAVIDGKNVLLTNFRSSVVPPPMAAFTLKAESYVNSIGFLRNSSQERNQFFTIASDNSLTKFNCVFEETRSVLIKKLKTVEQIGKYNFDKPISINHLIWLNESTIICSDVDSNLFKSTFDEENHKLIISKKTKVDDCIGSITDVDSTNFILHTTSGEVKQVSLEDFEIKELFKLPVFCENVSATLINETLKVISLKNRQTLFIDDDKIASDVITSFFVTENLLIYTTIDQLIFMKLETNKIIADRKIERGGKLIVVVPKDSRTVLQMPRGNLETVQPRILSLSIIGRLLDQKKYFLAMDLLRKQRINLNIIVDHNPIEFFKNLDHFIEETSNINWLNLFLSDLQNQDFTKTMYSSYYCDVQQKYPEDYSIENKRQIISDKMCELLMKRDFTYYMLPIVTCHVIKGDLEKALEVIWGIKQNDTKKAEEALKYLLYLDDVNNLYKIALGMYNFDLVLFVASKSQKDPKEYLPFLNELRQFDENYRKYKIDKFLKRNEKALENIVLCDENEYFDECLEHVENNNLFALALRLFSGKESQYKKVAQSYGDYLRVKQKLSEASLMYEKAGDLNQAILSSKHILDWRRCLSLAKKNGSSDGDIKDIGLSLVSGLQENGRHLEAAEIVKTFGTDKKALIDVLVKGKLYLQAIYEARLHSDDLIETVIKPSLNEFSEILIKTLTNDTIQYKHHTKRLETVRKEKANRIEFPDEQDVDDCDMFSDTSSVNTSRYSTSSRGTGKTFRSSKNRRKHERKLLSLKEGNPFEDIALIDALFVLIHKILEQQNLVRDICLALIELNLIEGGVQLQATYHSFINTIKISLDEIWIPEMIISGEVPVGPNVDFAQIQEGQHYSMIKPHQRFKPQLNPIDWEFDILK